MNYQLYELLRNKAIIAILDGDTKYGEYEFSDGRTIIVSMPYLSGPDLCNLSTMFGLPVTYARGGEIKSRWQYLDDLLGYCIDKKVCADLLAYMFAKDRFSEVLGGYSASEIDQAYTYVVTTILDKINGMLIFGGHEVVVINNSFIVREIGTDIIVDAPNIAKVDREYVRTMSERAMDDVENGKYDGAIAHSRTLLEETFCYVLEKKSVVPTTSGDINVLYKQVRNTYNMHTDPAADKRINKLLSGLNNIISAVAEMRNKDSDAHGVGAARISISEHHARLLVNAAMTMADFILSVAEKQQ